MSGNASEAVLAYIEGTGAKNLPRETPSQKAVAGGLESIDAFLQENFGDKKPGFLHDFFVALQESVFLSRLRLTNADSAFDFFERVNDRGRPLSKTDLLKNRLLQKIKLDDDFDNASDVWSNAEKALLPFGREGSMTFLLRAMLNADLNRKVKETDLFREWRPFVADDSGCLKLVDRIDAKSKVLSHILSGRTPLGENELHSDGTKFMKFTQNIGVKLAASHFSREAYDGLARILEARALLSLMSLERSQNYEALVVAWSSALQALPSDASSEDIRGALALNAQEINDLLEKAKLTARSLRYGKTPGQTNRIRLLLAIANYELLLQAPVYNARLGDFLQTSKKIRGKIHPGYDIEHVGAASTAAATLGEMVDSLGNLALFYSKENRSKGASAVEYKAESYGSSICFATKVLTNKPDQDASLESVIGKHRAHTVDSGAWTNSHVDHRFDFYWGLFEDRIRKGLVAGESH
jgi:hypothetical protein